MVNIFLSPRGPDRLSKPMPCDPRNISLADTENGFLTYRHHLNGHDLSSCRCSRARIFSVRKHSLHIGGAPRLERASHLREFCHITGPDLAGSCDIVGPLRSRCFASYKGSTEIKSRRPFGRARLVEEQDAFFLQECVDFSPGPRFSDELVVDIDILA